MSETNNFHSFYVSLLSGAAAGTAVDVSLFPLDTLKTRLQAPQGFRQAGGFRGIYSGLGPALLGSAPGAALFFLTYDSVKHLLSSRAPEQILPLVHSTSAAAGEVVACLVRVPVEIVKQRAQSSSVAPFKIVTDVLKRDGLPGFYRGYLSTVFREIPFSFIQFPIWEELKRRYSGRTKRPIQAHESAICGAIAGGFSAGVTTPLDVAKTRIMLAESGSAEAKGFVIQTLKTVYAEKGVSGLFAGVTPRVTWISIGGCVFFGVYEFVAGNLASKKVPPNPQ